MYSSKIVGRTQGLVRRWCALVAVILSVATAHAFAQCTEQQKLTASDAGADDRGGSVSVSGDVALVGARFHRCSEGRCGAAYAYRFDGTSWVEEQTLTASDGVANAFGESVSIHGDTAVVGADSDDCASGRSCGAAYVFRFDGSNWVEEQKLTASDQAEEDFFGHAVSMSGNTAVIGAPIKDCAAGRRCGSAYVFRFDGVNWVEEQKLTASDAGLGDQFGDSVTVSGDTAFVGAHRNDDCAPEEVCGAAYVFRFDGNEWVEEQKLTASDAAAVDRFGVSVSVSGDMALVGSWLTDCASGENCGSVYVFRFDGSNWVEGQKLTADDQGADDLFGASVDVSGDTAVIGAYGVQCASGDDCGAVYMFRFNGVSWFEVQKLTALDVAAGDFFGIPVSLSGNAAFVGAPQADCSDGVDCGAAYVFSCVSGPIGPCCLGVGGCKMLPPADCTALGGTFVGVNDTLNPNLTCTQMGDSDGVAILCDNCPNDNNVDQADCNDDGEGDACEAELAERDLDFDGVCNGADGCSSDPTKTDPGLCGCGNSDDDTDQDGTVDCNDGCPNDPNKVSPGVCGCGVVGERDADGDGLADCIDEPFAAVPTVSEWGLVVLTLLLLLLVVGKVYFSRRTERA